MGKIILFFLSLCFFVCLHQRETFKNISNCFSRILVYIFQIFCQKCPAFWKPNLPCLRLSKRWKSSPRLKRRSLKGRNPPSPIQTYSHFSLRIAASQKVRLLKVCQTNWSGIEENGGGKIQSFFPPKCH